MVIFLPPMSHSIRARRSVGRATDLAGWLRGASGGSAFVYQSFENPPETVSLRRKQRRYRFPHVMV
ncbi:hypothetical protein B7486_03505 [cyanobacterium TDX16]|nr:hypothetical protein B7486_03505 [cyanobacterium TDX16]